MTLKVYSKMEIGGDRSMKERTYVCCDLKSFYASVECVERGLDPMTTNLVVADPVSYTHLDVYKRQVKQHITG